MPEDECRTSLTVLVYVYNAYLFDINNLMVVRPKKSRHHYTCARFYHRKKGPTGSERD